MVTITRVAKLERTLKSELEELGGDITHTDSDWEWRNGENTQVRKEVEVYFDADDYDADLERELDSLVEDTLWEVDLTWDYDNNIDREGVLFTQYLY